MNLAMMRADLSDPDIDFPRSAMEWARDNRDEVAPALLAMLTACAKPGEITEGEATGAFHALHVLAQWRDARAFPVLCALARNEERLEEIVGDASTEYLHRLLAGLCDDEAALWTIAVDANVDAVVRSIFLHAWAWRAVADSIEPATAVARLVAAEKTIVDGVEDLLWHEWATALIAIDVEKAMPLIRDAFDRGAIDEMFATYRNYEDDADPWRRDPRGQRDTFLLENGPITDVIGYVEAWLSKIRATRAQYAGEEVADEPDESGGHGDEPATNPYRNVGRNDPCPCGSGKKFKKCCLASLDEPLIP